MLSIEYEVFIHPPPRRRASVQASAQCLKVDILDIDILAADGSHM